MKKTYLVKLALFSLFFLLFANCHRNKVVNGIEVSMLLLSAAKENEVDYCNLLKEAINGKENSIRELTLLIFYEAAGYDHGSVIVDLIEVVGEDKFIKSLMKLNPEEKQLVKGYITVGLEYRDNQKIKMNNSLEKVFPIIYSFLN